ncbi:MAG TPA: SDR family NAD(P)-dependent oxidoreductase [Gaiellaceae bacterium]|jgi:NAD(P)-dependent dehydrogenase (short-subunit alcohol dehydrogenase family)|nr:SDR family NAD(P)-dependent oxidoreductase [Gaiellaceae bacterium]
MDRLDGKVALITGSGSGIGEAGAMLFAQEGAKVVVVDIVPERVESAVAAIQEAGGEAIGVAADVSKLDEVEAMVAKTVESYGRIDIFWSNAGIVRGRYTPVEEFSVDLWNEVIDANLNAFFYGLKHVVPQMKAQRKGAILSTSSVAGLIANVPGRAPYTATKGALIALTRLLALELAGFNIRVNCIAPGRVRTNIHKGRDPAPEPSPFGMEWPEPILPLPETDATRRAEPIELAHTALYLVSDEVGPLTGITIAHDGGRTSR